MPGVVFLERVAVTEMFEGGNMQQDRELRALLERIDHKGYPAYKDTKGEYRFPGYILAIDHVQGDPFAAPSAVRIYVAGKDAGFPRHLYDTEEKRVALEHTLLQGFGKSLEAYSFKARGSGKSGLMAVSRTGAEMLERSGCHIDREGGVTLRMSVGFPANGRTIQAGELIRIFFDFLPRCVQGSLYFRRLDGGSLERVAALAASQRAIRDQMAEKGLVVFVANGAILPRESGISQRPLRGAVPFTSPRSLEVEMTLADGSLIRGMGIPRGITMIAGGGYHGKSTLLEAIERGVYNHCPGDGREYVLTEDTAVKLRAEDGRSIKNVDISLFIRELPGGKATKSFYTEDASGSTSQAAGVMEAMESGARTLLIDEDTSATNFMVRDALMQYVVHGDKEPIIPFSDRVRELYEKSGVSVILVAGSSGAYFHKADLVIQMDQYVPVDITQKAKEAAEKFPLTQQETYVYTAPVWKRRVTVGGYGSGGSFPTGNGRAGEGGREDGGQTGRSYGNRGGRGGREERVKVKGVGTDAVMISKEKIEMRYVEQLVDQEQLNTLGYLLKYANEHVFDGRKTLIQAVDELERGIRQKGFLLFGTMSQIPSDLALPRRQEIFACFNRYRSLNI